IDTHAERRDAQPPTGSMLAVRIPLRTSRLRDGGMDTKLVLGWTALVAVAMIGVVTFVTMGFGAVAALGVLGAGLYRKHKPALDRWLAALE
ncbi:MAG: hypothetical protein M3R64_07835, partial [Pseudomonadota bacterium]|nr:hypothetical protein [Pseudomonadota bacterium]